MGAIKQKHTKLASAQEQKIILTKAVLRLAERLLLSRRELSLILGISEPSLSRLYTQDKSLLDPASKEGQLGILLLRVYRSLDTLFGGNTEQCQLWLRSQNSALQSMPLQLMQSIEGLVSVVQYLDAIRGKN